MQRSAFRSIIKPNRIQKGNSHLLGNAKVLVCWLHFFQQLHIQMPFLSMRNTMIDVEMFALCSGHYVFPGRKPGLNQV